MCEVLKVKGSFSRRQGAFGRERPGSGVTWLRRRRLNVWLPLLCGLFLESGDEVGGQGALEGDGSEIEDFVPILVVNSFDGD